MSSNKYVFSILAIFLTVGFAGANTLNVGQGQAYTTIQSAIDSANPGDVIAVSEGTYAENLIVKKNGISIEGKSKEKTIIDGKKTGSVVRVDSASNVKISGFTIQNSGGSGKDDAGISLYRANNNFIANVILINNIVGISLYTASSNNTVSGNEIKSNSDKGIFIYTSNDNSIYNNDIQGNNFGIYADSDRGNRIYSNNFIDNKNQAYDNSGLNSWDDGSSGNYWNTYKGSGAYSIPGGAKAQDNYPRSSAVIIRYETVDETTVPAGTQRAGEGTSSKTTPGFTAIVVLISFAVVFSRLSAVKR